MQSLLYRILFLILLVASSVYPLTPHSSQRALIQRPTGRSFAAFSDSELDIDSVSEAEALLACRAYLQRKNRLGQWTKAHERKERAERSMSRFADHNYDVGGFFWENPMELKYFHLSRPLQSSDNSTLDDYADETEEELPEGEDEIWETVNPKTTLQRVDLYKEDEFDNNDDIADDVTEVFDWSPSGSRLNRSRAAKTTWSDPSFRTMWYERRWGGKKRKENDPKRQKQQMEERLRTIDPEAFLSNTAVAKMTEEEIAEAIRTYASSRLKRGVSRKRASNERKQFLDSSPSNSNLSRDSLYSNRSDLENAMLERSERAKRLYEKRRSNHAKAQVVSKRKSGRKNWLPMGAWHHVAASTPDEALKRVTSFLDANQVPERMDVQLLLEPSKLAGRKEVLRRILYDCFDLRGKVVPVDTDEWAQYPPATDSRLLFVTKASIDQVGAFCLTLLERYHSDRRARQEGR